MRSLAEIRFRIGQIVERNLNRTLPQRSCVFRDGRLNARYFALDQIGAHLQSEDFKTVEKRFFRSLREPDRTRAVFERCFGDHTEKIVGQALFILKKEFPIFGKKRSYGDPVSWFFDPVSGRTAPFKFHSKIDFLNYTELGDHKLIWELNRHQYMLVLAKAYWLTADERFVNEWVLQIEDWMRKNPPGMGINWASSLEISLRSMAWIWCWFFFRHSRQLSDHFRLKFLLYLYESGRRIEKNLSCFFSPNTHLTGEALGLFYLGLFFAGLEPARAWQRRGGLILMEQLDRHVLSDGSYMEQSTWYHKYTTDIYLHFYLLLQANSLPVPPVLMKKIQALLDFIQLVRKPDGKVPIIGDDDGGALMPLGSADPGDFRGVLSTGAALFGRTDYRQGSGGYAEETLWLMGPASQAAFSRLESEPPKKESADFPESGYYVMRNGWEADSEYLLIDCGPHGWLKGGHAHSDLNNIVVCVGGRDFLIDPGTYTYSESRKWRDYFRTSPAHNTVSADGLSQCFPSGPFSWVETARPESVRWVNLEKMDYVSASVSAYQYFRHPVLHTREIVFLKKERIWVIRDLIRSDRKRGLAARYHFPDLSVRLSGERFILEEGARELASAWVQGDPTPRLSLVDDWMSPIYSRKDPSKTGVCQVHAAEAVFVTVIEAGQIRTEWEFCHQPHSDLVSEGRKSRPPLHIEFASTRRSGGAAGQFSSGEGPVCSVRRGESLRLLYLDCDRITVDGEFTIRFRKSVDYAYLEIDSGSMNVLASPRVDFESESLAGKTLNIHYDIESCQSQAI